MSRKRQELYEKLQWSRQTQEDLFVERSENQIHEDTLPRITYQVESNLAITPPSFAQRPSSREGPNPSNLHIPPHIIAENNAQRAKHGLYPHITIPFSKTTHSTMGVISGRAQRSTSSGGRNGPRELLTSLTTKQQSFGQKEVSTSGQPKEQLQLSVPHRDEPANRREPWPVSKEGQYVTYEQEREELWAQEGYSNVLCRTFRLGAPSSPTRNLKYDYPTASPRHSRSPEREEVAHPEQQRTESPSPSAQNEDSWSLDGEKIKEDSPHNLSHNKRVGGMTLNQRAAQIFLDPQAKEEYIKMQHTHFSKMLKKLRDVPGYRDLSQAPADTLPELKTALAAVRKRDEMLQRQAAQAEKEHRKQQQVPSLDGRGREGGSGANVFREESRETSDSSKDEGLEDKDGSTEQDMVAEASHQLQIHVHAETDQRVSFKAGPGSPEVPQLSAQPSSLTSSETKSISVRELYIPGQEYSQTNTSALSPTNSSILLGGMSPQNYLQGQSPSRPTTVMRLLTSSRPRTTGNKRLDRHSSAPVYFVPDVAITPDNEDEATLLKLLQSLKNRDVMFDEKDKVAGTYSRLLKPALNSASAPVNFGQDEDWDPELTLGWSNRGLGDKKMGVLKDTIMGNPHLSGIKLAGNNLGDECVAEILAVLSSPDAPHIRQIDFSSNPKLTWKCSQALASSLGLDSQAGMEEGINLPLEPLIVTSCPIEMLRLSRLLLGGVKLGDKGATLIAGALRNNRILKELDLSRCKISDIGGIALMSALEVGCLISLDLSWNALRGESARALRQTLTTNGSLQKIDLGHNGLSDQDASVILMGLTHHGTWRYVDLSYNNLGAGSALVISELTDVLARRAGRFIRDGKYAEHWDLEQFPAGCIDSGSWLDPIMGSPRKPSTRLPSHEAFGAQLQQGPLLIDASGNPIGFAGLRQVLHSLDWMSTVLEEAVEDAKDAAGGAGVGSPHEDALPWPINVRISNCNVDITDVPPEGSEVEGMDSASPNPFLPSIMRLMEVSASDEGKRKSKKSGGEKGRAEAGKSKEYFLSAQSQSLDLTSPAGKYQINLAHPASWLVVRHLLDLSVEIQRAADTGVTGVSVNLKDVTLNEKPFRVDRLPSTADLDHGLLKFNIQSQSVLLANNPSPITDMVVEWMLLTLGDLSCAQLWKLSVIAVACSHFYFTWDQALKLIELFDADMATSERLRAGEMLYARCVQPLDFWLEALPKLPFQQAELLMARMGELAAFDIDNPSGRFMLNLSRGIDRFVALRLQVTSVLEGSWRTCRYFVNWRNAMINGVKLSMEGLQKLREYTMPCSGTLRIDYVTYKVPEPDTKSCTKADMKSLLTQLRTIYRSFDKEMHGLRLEYLPHARLQSAISAAATKSAQIKKRWSVAKTFCISIQNMATRLESLFQHENRQVGQEPAKQVRGMSTSTGSSTKSIDASKAPEGSAPDTIAPSQTQPPPKSWWQEAGFSQVGNALISKFKEVHRQREEKMASIAARHRAEAEAQFYSSTYTRTFSRLLSSVGSSRRSSVVLPDCLMSSPSIEQAGLPMLSEEGMPVDITVSLEASQLVNTAPPAPAPLTTLPTATPPSTAASAHSPPVIVAAFSLSPPLVTNPTRSTSPGKQGAKGLLNSKGNPLKGLPPISPPQNRTEGASLSPEQELQAQELVVALLRVHSIADATKLLSKFSAKHTARTLYMMVRMDPVYGTRAAARLLDAMAPISAIRFLFQLFDQIQPLLPAEVRRKLMAACRSELIQRLKMLLTQVDGLSLKRCRQIRITLQCFASFHYVTSDQVLEILKRLRFEQDRCSALVTLWARIIDRPGIYNIFQVLSVEEQRQVLIRLGYWHVWTTLGRPQSLHFYLDLTDQEQKDVAKDVVKLGCKASIAAKAAAKAQGITQAARHLVNLRGNGSLMSIAEDEKMWMMIENSYSSLEFDYAPTADQLEKKKLAAVITIQKQWRTIQAMRRVVYTPLEGASRSGNESMETLAIPSTSA